MLKTIRTNLAHEIQRCNEKVSNIEKKAGISQSVLSKFINGTSNNPSFETIYAAATDLGCSIDELMGIKPTHKTKTQKHVAWNDKFFDEVVKYVNKRINPKLSALQVIDVISEIYTYSLDQGSKNIDERFANWLISKS